MRKPILAFIICALWFGTAAALQPISDRELGKITGAAGVSLMVDDFVGYMSFSEPIEYTDTDYEFYAQPEEIGMVGPAKIMLEGVVVEGIGINAIAPDRQLGDIPAAFDVSQSQVIDTFEFRPLTIDASSDIPALCWDASRFKRSGVIIGIPTVNLTVDHFGIERIAFASIDRVSMDTVGDVHDRKGHPGDGSVNASMFTLDINDVNLAFLDGLMAVMPHLEGIGVDIALDDVRLFLNIGEIRITDTDGLWDPLALQYDNDFSEHLGGGGYLEDYYEGKMAATFYLKNLKFDLLHINSLIYTSLPDDPASTPTIQSPGRENIHPALATMNNFTMADMPQDLKDVRGRALEIDMTSNLPIATALHQDAGGSGSITGVLLALPTVEIYADHFSIEGIVFDNPNYPDNRIYPYGVVNDQTSFIQFGIDGLTTAILSGTVEVAPH